MNAIVVAGVASGVGKTTITLGLMAALRRRGLTVQGFKVGPDFIDPAFHALVTGRPSYTLDAWMCGRDAVLATVARQAADADVTIIEGVMGGFDGIDGVSDDGSTAQVAKWLAAAGISVMPRRTLSIACAPVMSWPSKTTVPRAGRTRPKIALSVVVLPAPLWPNIATISPGATRRSTSKSTGRRP